MDSVPEHHIVEALVEEALKIIEMTVRRAAPFFVINRREVR